MRTRWVSGLALVMVAKLAVASELSDERAALLRAIERELAPDAQPAWTAEDSEHAEVWRARPPSPAEAIDAFLGRAHDPSMPPLRCSLAAQMPALGSAINDLVKRSAACFAKSASSDARCRDDLPLRLARLRAQFLVDDFHIANDLLHAEREIAALTDARHDAAFIGAHDMDLCIAAIPAWPASTAGPIEQIEQCKARSIATASATSVVTVASETARLERIVRTQHVNACKTKLVDPQAPHPCHQRYRDAATVNELRVELTREANALRALYDRHAPHLPEVVASLSEQLQHTPCWQHQISAPALEVDCTATPDPIVVQKPLLDRLYQHVRARTWWTEWQGTQGVARDALQLSCDEAARADQFDSALHNLHLSLASCLQRAAAQPTSDEQFAVAAGCRNTAANSRKIIIDDPRYALPKPKKKK